MIKTFILTILASLTLAFSFPVLSSASGVFGICSSASGAIANSSVCQDSNSSKAKTDPAISLIKSAINIISIIIGIAAVFTIIISGIRLVLSSGSSENVNGARTAIIYAVIGIAIAVSAQLIIAFVLDKIS